MHSLPGAFEHLTDLYQEAEALIDAGEHQQAIERLDEGIGLDDHFRQRYVTMYALRAFAHHKLQHHELAIADYGRAIEMEPEFNQAQYFFQRGMCLAALERFEEAVADFSRSIELEPNHPGPHHLRGRLYTEVLGRHREAIADLDRVIALNDHPDAHRLRDRALRALEGEPQPSG